MIDVYPTRAVSLENLSFVVEKQVKGNLGGEIILWPSFGCGGEDVTKLQGQKVRAFITGHEEHRVVRIEPLDVKNQ